VDNFYKQRKMLENFFIWAVDNPVDKAVENSPPFLDVEVIHRLSTGYPQGYPQSYPQGDTNTQAPCP